jgi:hypothetical protein
VNGRSPAVARVVGVLEDAGYEVRPPPTRIGSLTFDFPAVLTAKRGLDLVVVVDTIEEPPQRISNALEGLGRALDRVASRRPITVVLVGPSPRQAVVEALARTGRVLNVGTPLGEHAPEVVREALAVLLPLTLPEVEVPTLQSWDHMAERLLAAHEPEVVSTLLDAAGDATDAVRDAMRSLLAAPLEELEQR